jgi:hypothetical protein
LSYIGTPNDPTNQQLDFIFDDIATYQSGLTYYGSTILRLTVSDTAAGIAGTDCQWKLKMFVTNGGAPVPPSEWVTLQNYGSGLGAKPPLSLIQVRVSNACATSPINGTWQTFAPANGDEIDIINDPSFINAAGGCSGTEVNGEGSYLTSFGEFSFIIDYRIIPLFNYVPGKYEMNIKFCLRED